MNIREARPTYESAIDFGDVISRTCPACGSEFIRLIAVFDEAGEIATYFTDAECVNCGSWFKAPTPLDGENDD